MPLLQIARSGFFLTITFLFLAATPVQEDWGFFGHRRINRLAVFTLPPELIPLYKHHIEYVTEHAVDPDKRRYASKHEAVRHYIDIDHWGTFPFAEVPRSWIDVLQKYTDFYAVTKEGDTLALANYADSDWSPNEMIWRGKHIAQLTKQEEININGEYYHNFFLSNILSNYYDEEWSIDPQYINAIIAPATLDSSVSSVLAVDRFSEYGILPYHLVKMQRRLTKAFEEKDAPKIIQLSSEFGHYLGDAHVPLHTTENYNGQLSNQVGIHGFWESRIPELFADEEFDYFVGKAEYIENPQEYYWDIVLKSHTYLDSLLAYEIQLKNSFPTDQQFCYEERSGQTIHTQCREYAQAYRRLLNGQVEARMRGSILSVGSAWYTAWVDAGQPDVQDLLGNQLPDPEPIEAESGLSDREKERRRGH